MNSMTWIKKNLETINSMETMKSMENMKSMTPCPHDLMPPWPMLQLNERVVHWNLINNKVIWNKKWNKVSKLNKFVKTIKFTFDNVEIDKI